MPKVPKGEHKWKSPPQRASLVTHVACLAQGLLAQEIVQSGEKRPKARRRKEEKNKDRRIEETYRRKFDPQQGCPRAQPVVCQE